MASGGTEALKDKEASGYPAVKWYQQKRPKKLEGVAERNVHDIGSNKGAKTGKGPTGSNMYKSGGSPRGPRKTKPTIKDEIVVKTQNFYLPKVKKVRSPKRGG